MATSPRVVDVTAHTTLDRVDGAARGRTWREDTAAVADVCRPDGRPAVVRLDVELDGADLDRIEGHAQSLLLTPAQARTLAAALGDAAAEVADD